MILGKHPIEYNHGSKTCWVWFKDYDRPPAGLWSSLLPVPLFHAVRIAAKLRKSRNGREAYGAGFDTEQEAQDYAERAYQKLLAEDAEALYDLEDADYDKKLGLMAVPAEIAPLLKLLPPERVRRALKQNKHARLVKAIRSLRAKDKEFAESLRKTLTA